VGWPADSNDPPSSLLLNQSSCSTKTEVTELSWDAVTADTVINCWRQPAEPSLPKEKQPSDTAGSQLLLLLPLLSGQQRRAHCSVTSHRTVNDGR